MLRVSWLMLCAVLSTGAVHAQENAAPGKLNLSFDQVRADEKKQLRAALNFADKQIRENNPNLAIESIKGAQKLIDQSETLQVSVPAENLGRGQGGFGKLPFIAPDFSKLASSKELHCDSNEHVKMITDREAKCEKQP